jgi:F like protein
VTRIPGPTLEQLDALGDDYAGLLARTLADVASATGIGAGVEDLGLLRTGWANHVDETLLPALGVGFEVGAAQVRVGLREVVGLTAAAWTDVPSTQDALAEAYLATARNRLVGVGDELWEHAREELLEGMRQGEGVDELAARIVGAPGMTEARASVVARTEVIGATNAGALAQVRATGMTGWKEWIATEDNRVRDTHEFADHDRVRLDQHFIVGGFPMERPHDPAGPPQETVNCRCSLGYDLDLDSVEPVTEGGNGDGGWQVAAERDRSFLAGVFAKGLALMARLLRGRETLQADATGGDDMTAAATETVEATSSVSTEGAWEGVLVVEGSPTGDGRQFSSGALTWAELPLPLKWQEAEGPGHAGAVIVGRIDEIRREGNQVIGRGVFDLDGVSGQEAHRLVAGRFLRGVSIMPDDIGQSDVEYIYPNEVSVVDETGDDDAGQAIMDLLGQPELEVYHAGRIRSATLCAEAAFVEAEVRLTSDGCESCQEPMAAAAYSITIEDVPPATWFEEPTEEPAIGAITVTDEGRVFGYLAPGDVAHVGLRRNGQTRYAPKETVDYAKFMNKPALVMTEDGKVEKIPAGNITMGCGHAPLRRPNDHMAPEHYDNSCSVVARIRVGENQHGTWAAGALLPGVTADQVNRMFACQLSGDWQPHETLPGWDEMVAALLVPVPGFPKAQKASVRVRDGHLVASAVPVRYQETADRTQPDLGPVKERIAASIQRDRASRLAAARERVTVRG